MNTSKALCIASRSDIGRVRARNEDCTGTAPDIGLVVLADGMGGYRGGQVASTIAVQTVVRQLEIAMRSVGDSGASSTGGSSQQSVAVRKAVVKANEAICKAAEATPEYRGMGTTLVMALFYGDRVTVANVGDSRLYRLRADHLEQITIDHSLRQEMVNRGICTPEQARVSLNKNLVTRALGTEKTVAVDIHESAVAPDDIYLLCSDGLNDMLVDDEISHVVKTCGADLDRAADELIGRAIENGGRDNVSVILVASGKPHAME